MKNQHSVQTTRTRRLGVAVALAICAGAADPSAFGQPVVNGDFEANGNSGYSQITPTGWTETAVPGNYVVGGGSSSPFTNAYPLGDKAELMIDSGPALYQTFTATTNAQVYFNFDFLNTDNSQGGTYYVYFDGWTGGNGASVLFQIRNSFTVSGGVKDETIIPTLTSYLWYNVRGTFDYTAGTVTGAVYTVAGGITPVATFSDTLRTTGATGVDRIYITDGSGFANAGLYLDNFALTTGTPPPAPTTNGVACAISPTVSVSWFASNNIAYKVQWTTPPASGGSTWTDLTTSALGNGTTNTVLDSNSSLSRRAYRVLSTY